MTNDNKNQEPEPKIGTYMALGAGIGVAVGTGIGAAMGNIAIGAAIGVALGPAMGLIFYEQNKNKSDDNS